MRTPFRGRWTNPWVDGDRADPFFALLIAVGIGVVLAAVIFLLR
jgi:hypothetical protein